MTSAGFAAVMTAPRLAVAPRRQGRAANWAGSRSGSRFDGSPLLIHSIDCGRAHQRFLWSWRAGAMVASGETLGTDGASEWSVFGALQGAVAGVGAAARAPQVAPAAARLSRRQRNEMQGDRARSVCELSWQGNAAAIGYAATLQHRGLSARGLGWLRQRRGRAIRSRGAWRPGRRGDGRS